MIFDYSVQRTYNQSIDIVDMGNTAIRCSNDAGDSYYMILKTVMGMTTILSFGPVLEDMIVDDFNVTYMRCEYKEKIVRSAINKFINDPRKEIGDVEEVTAEEAFGSLPDIVGAFQSS